MTGEQLLERLLVAGTRTLEKVGGVVDARVWNPANLVWHWVNRASPQLEGAILAQIPVLCSVWRYAGFWMGEGFHLPREVTMRTAIRNVFSSVPDVVPAAAVTRALALLLRRSRPAFVFMLATALVAVLLPASVQAQTLDVRHAFTSEYGRPGPLLQTADGSLYGGTDNGGRFGLGSIFVLRPNGSGWTYSTLWEFSGGDGISAGAGLTEGGDGFLYGVTDSGGSDVYVYGRTGAGTVFRIDPVSGALTTLHRFNGSDGMFPRRLIRGSDGQFYGTTRLSMSGGFSRDGTVFRMDPSGALTTLHVFTAAEGAFPYELAQGPDGNFYGTLAAGVSSGGAVFRMTADGAVTILHRFADFAGGHTPNAGLTLGSDNKFYGTTQYGGQDGGGVIFRIDSAGAFEVLYSFRYGNGNPAGLVEGADGTFYGRTELFDFQGTFFRLDPSGSVTTLHAFTPEDGGTPISGAILRGADGAFYGSTLGGYNFTGGTAWGTVFRIDSGGSLTTLHNFAGNGGIFPAAGLLLASDGSLYGTAEWGGSGTGTVFRINPSNSFEVVHRFVTDDLDGDYPRTALIQGSDGALYGTTLGGGADPGNAGTLFRIDSLGSLTTLHSFTLAEHCGDTPIDGAHPLAGLVQDPDGSFYGTAAGGWRFNCFGGDGTIFRLDPSGALTTLHRFSGGDGRYPESALVRGADGKYYGTTTEGGTFNLGTVFRIDKLGSFTTLYSFSGTDGSWPAGGLTLGSDGQLYGTTTWGGTYDWGTVFRIDEFGSLTTLHSFSGDDGGGLLAPLLQIGSSFYGTTSEGGAHGYGTIFKIGAGGSLTTLHHFAGSDGARPMGQLTWGSDGRLYGTASRGGPYGFGVVFALTLPPNTPTGSNVAVEDTDTPNTVKIVFDTVSAAGSTTVTPIDPATAGDVPGGFALLGSVAYQISTTAVFSGPITIAFVVPGAISEADFDDLIVLHNENGVLVDVTATSPARHYATRTIYATTGSFSPFYIARKGPRVSVLFDQTKAHRAGSTVPVKVALLNKTNVNISSTSIPLTVKNLIRVGANSTSPVIDAGQANADGTFRYDERLRGYIFNLSTKGLQPGRWVLSFYAGLDRSFEYLISFEVK